MHIRCVSLHLIVILPAPVSDVTPNKFSMHSFFAPSA
jgi:hypothetical protein